jgi:hypothetical protein
VEQLQEELSQARCKAECQRAAAKEAAEEAEHLRNITETTKVGGAAPGTWLLPREALPHLMPRVVPRSSPPSYLMDSYTHGIL